MQSNFPGQPFASLGLRRPALARLGTGRQPSSQGLALSRHQAGAAVGAAHCYGTRLGEELWCAPVAALRPPAPCSWANPVLFECALQRLVSGESWLAPVDRRQPLVVRIRPVERTVPLLPLEERSRLP